MQLVVGTAGAQYQVCDCDDGARSEQSVDACCLSSVAVATATIPACTGCHLIPTPAVDATMLSPAPHWSLVALIPRPVQIAALVWPTQQKCNATHLRTPPPDSLTRRLRTVILIG